MAYRDDLVALEARKAAAEAELVEKTRARDEAARLVDEARYLAQAEDSFIGNGPDPKRYARRRRRLRWFAVAAALVVGVGGLAVYPISRRASPDAVEVMFLQMAMYEGAICECGALEFPRSSDCLKRVTDDMTTWSTEVAKAMPEPKLDEKQTKRAMEMGERMGKCMQRAMMPPPPPEPQITYEPACCSTLNKPFRADLPASIDRSMISAAIARVKALVSSCGDKSSTEGRVKLHVHVDGDGRVTKVSIEDAPDPVLGACVAAAVQKASFAETLNGGSFSYPFVF